MLQAEWFILMVVGSIFIFLGLVAIIWDKVEKKGYYGSLVTRFDVREYLEHQPEPLELGALKIGGWIAIAVGLVVMAMGGAFWFWG